MEDGRRAASGKKPPIELAPPLRSQVLVHGRNGRVDRFPSLDHIPPLPSPSPPPKHLGAATSWVRSGGSARRWWGKMTGDGRGNGRPREPCTARCAMSSVRSESVPCPPLSFSFSLSLSLFLLHGDSTRCDRNLCR